MAFDMDGFLGIPDAAVVLLFCAGPTAKPIENKVKKRNKIALCRMWIEGRECRTGIDLP